MKILLNLISYIALCIVVFLAVYKYLPLSWLDTSGDAKFGSTITTIQGTDTLSSSRTVINTNFSNLNTGKAEIASNNNFSSLQNFQNASTTGVSAGYGYFGTTATSSFSNVGALTLITPLLTASGGTGSSTLSINHVLLGSTTNAIGIVSGLGSSGQFLTSGGSGLPPSWTSATFDTTGSYNFTGSNFFASTTMATTTIGWLNVGPIVATSTLKIGGLTYTWPSSQSAGTFLKTNGSGTLSWGSAVTGLTSTTSTATLTAGTNPTNVTKSAICVSPQVVSGGGFSGVPNSTANVNAWITQANYPSASDTWTVTLSCDGAGCGSGTLTVYALCINP